MIERGREKENGCKVNQIMTAHLLRPGLGEVTNYDITSCSCMCENMGQRSKVNQGASAYVGSHDP